MVKIKSFRFGFTLIELLVVISIIGILTTLIAANLNSARSRARDAERKSDMRNIATALRLYYNDWGQYPPLSASGGIAYIGGCNAASAGTQPKNQCLWGGKWSDGFTTTYMTKLPEDPLTGQHYFYKLLATDQYILSACLENKSDTSGIADNGANGYNLASGFCPSQWVFVVQP